MAKITKKIMGSKKLDQCLSRLAKEIMAKNDSVENLVIVGMQTRGVFIAKTIAKKIEINGGAKIKVGSLDVSFYRDDFRIAFKRPIVQVTRLPFSIDKMDVILVDDVLFTGRTVRAALDELIDFGRPKTVQLVVLIDRGHRELPIQPDFTGKVIRTSPNEEIAVRVMEKDGEDSVYTVEAPQGEKKSLNPIRP